MKKQSRADALHQQPGADALHQQPGADALHQQPGADALHSLYDDGRRYDLLYGAGEGDIAFYLQMAERFGGPILELACGTGKYLLPLARASHDVTGIDLAPAMLAEAERKAKETRVNFALFQADMRDFQLHRRFGLIFIAGNSLVHLHSRSDVEGFLARVRGHLLPGGVFVVDVFVPDARLLARTPDERHAFGVFDDPLDGVRTEVTHTACYDPILQISEIRLYSRRDGEERETESGISLRMWFPAELDTILPYNGFTIIESYGGHHGGPLTSRSGKQILVCCPGSPT